MKTTPTDATSTISSLAAEALAFRDARNWKQFHDPKNLAAGLAIEAAELQELFLWKSPAEVTALVADPSGAERVRHELADCLVYLLYLGEACGVDLAQAVHAKLAHNALKYPIDKSYNSHRKYTELK